jgi:hypothetical protein
MRYRLTFWYVVFGLWFVTLFVPLLEYRKSPMSSPRIIEIWFAYQIIWESVLARDTDVLLLGFCVALLHTAAVYTAPRAMLAADRWLLERVRKPMPSVADFSKLSLRTRHRRFHAGGGNL